MKVIECKQVDRWDGGDRHNFDFYISPAYSDEQIKAKYPDCVVSKKTFVVFESFQEVEDNRAHVLRKQVWAKLTPLERKAIGMSDPN